VPEARTENTLRAHLTRPRHKHTQICPASVSRSNRHTRKHNDPELKYTRDNGSSSRSKFPIRSQNNTTTADSKLYTLTIVPRSISTDWPQCLKQG